MIFAAGCAPEADSSSTDGGLDLTQTQIEVGATDLNGLRILSAMELTSNESAFGGFSGLLIDGTSLVAISDRGWFLDAALTSSSNGLHLYNATMTQMRDSVGDVIDIAGVDAEGLTRQNGATLISFERDHRVMTREGQAQLGSARHHRAFETLGTNQGLEALATLPNGQVLVIGEKKQDNGYVVYVLGLNGIAARGWLPPVTRHAPTGADIGPDGKLYVVFRDYSALRGVSILIRRYSLDDAGLPNPGSREDMARFETSTGIDNMEGISLWQDTAGRTRLTMISDDNFNVLQRTILVDMVLN